MAVANDPFLTLAARLVDHGHGLLDVAMADRGFSIATAPASSYDYFVSDELPRLINDFRGRRCAWVSGSWGEYPA